MTNTYDAQGRVATQPDARGLLTGQQTTFAYSLNPTTTIVTYPATSLEHLWNPKVEDTYDGQERIIRRVSRPVAGGAEDATGLYAYDAGSNLSAVTDARGNTANSCYDVDYAGAAIPCSRGNLTRRIDPPPSPGADRPVTLFQYDGKNNLIQTIPPRGVSGGAIVDCTTNLSGSIDLRYATAMAYDATQTKLLSVVRRATDPDLGTPTMLTTTFEYGDAANPGLVTRVIPPRGNTGPAPDYAYATSFAYRASGIAAGMLLTTTDPLGNQTTYGYDGVGRRTSMVDAMGYAPGGVPAEHTTRVTRAKGDAGNERVVEYAYDGLNRLRREVQYPSWPAVAGALTTTTGYDANSNRQTLTDPLGQTTAFGYDALNRLTNITYTVGSTPNVAYTYDANGNRLSMADGTGTTSYSYDELSRLITVATVRAAQRAGDVAPWPTQQLTEHQPRDDEPLP